jgi:hypothetical protein
LLLLLVLVLVLVLLVCSILRVLMQKVAKELMGLAGKLPSLQQRVAASAQPALSPQMMAALAAGPTVRVGGTSAEGMGVS